jgi:hypothetical protein
MTEPTSPPVGASVWETELYGHLSTHIDTEQEMLDEYASAAQATESKAFAYLVHLLLDDERRHHEAFVSLASSLKTEAELSGAEPEIPYLDLDRADHAKIREITERLLRCEKDDAAALKRLHKNLEDVEDTSLWDLLVNILRRDTDKHIAILEFILHHTGPNGK